MMDKIKKAYGWVVSNLKPLGLGVLIGIVIRSLI